MSEKKIYKTPYEKGRRKNNKIYRDDFIIGLCANCHRKYKTSKKDVHISLILKAIERGVLG